MDDSTEYLKQFARERGMAWPQIQQTGDAGTELLVRYGVRGIPMSYLIDRTGTVVARDMRGDDYANEVRKRLGKPSEKTPQTETRVDSGTHLN